MAESDRNSRTDLTVGLGGATRHGCVALADRQSILGVCEQERVTRVRAAGFNSNGFPDEALDLLLRRSGRRRDEITRYALAEDGVGHDGDGAARIDLHRAHACASYLSSPFTSAVIVICDHEQPKVSVWKGSGSAITRVDWPWIGPGFSDLYSACTNFLGFGHGGDQRFEALARLEPDHQDARLEKLFTTDGMSLGIEAGWETRAANWFQMEGLPASKCAMHAAALQRRIVELLLTFVAKVREVTQAEYLCLGGSLFYHSSVNTLVRTSALFSRVFIPVNPGTAGLAVGAALHEMGVPPRKLSPFMGPAYTLSEIKATLDSCKLPYTLVNESKVIETAVDALKRGMLVGWYEGAMEWGPRALGARSILANPFAPYVLENLNHFLKQREPWRGYALSALGPAVEEHFSGPSESPFMECDFRPRDPEMFRNVLPTAKGGIRIQVVGPDSPPGFQNLLAVFGAAAGIPCVVNTSFNGFHEPIVCSPRDAIRVFYGTGIDVLLLDRFIVTK